MSAVLPTPAAAGLSRRGLLLGLPGWTGVTTAFVVIAIIVPILNLAVPDGSPGHLSDYAVQLVAKIMCYAICALAIDLIWGYAGILSLGHGLFFALGGYAMGMYLMRQIGRDGQYRMDMPDFMVFLNWKQFPWHWAVSDSFCAQMLLVVLAPGLIAFVFGYFAFRSRIKGVYFSIITQAMT
ncbi:MAG: urea ABC transporter permease subunit UrtC, partial [Proteobacteria bacterium]|nr:urea ABC transporter permease subunit UrtC [Pseudomonadota bacterium]